MSKNSINRFVEKYDEYYEQAAGELRSGRKRSHWMWFIFPQITGLGSSDLAKYYAIQNIDEAKFFLASPCGEKMQKLLEILLQLKTNDPTTVFGDIDAVKLKSSMTLFAAAAPGNQLFYTVLDKFYDGQPDEKTVNILRNQYRRRMSVRQSDTSEYFIWKLKEFWKVIQDLKHGTSTLRCANPLFPMMKVLPHLHFPEGSILDCYQVEYPLGLGAEPVLYVRKENEQSFSGNGERDSDNPAPNLLNDLSIVSPEFTQEGVWELILLIELGTQFNLVWHANYNLRRIICNMKEFFEGWYCGTYDDCYFKADRLTDYEKTRLLSWDIAPKVKLEDSYAIAEYCLFSPFSGFFTVRREIQFEPELHLSKPLITERLFYDCGIKF